MVTEYIENICKIGQGAECCRYLLFNGRYFECGKMQTEEVSTLEQQLIGGDLKLPVKRMIDLNARMGKMVAQGDNCEGKDPIP